MIEHLSDRWLSVEEVASYLGINKGTLYKWITRKSIPAHKAGRLWKFKKEEIDNWVKSGSNSSKEDAAQESNQS
jgi:excisionase family DNA binding protein